jgi:putative ABC transport system ATP-binding protein
MITVALNDVTKVYQSGEHQVRALAVSLSINKGEFVVLAGPSGSGKSTMLNLIGALDSPTSGQVMFEGRDLSTLSRSERARLRLERIGFVFQDHNLLPVLTAMENADLGLVLRGVGAGERRERLMPIFERIGLKGLEDRRPFQLSGGQRQRVAIARALAGDPGLVLADEPTASVDSATGMALIDTMSELNAVQKTSFLIASHDPAVIQRAHRLIRLHDGQVVSDGKP